MTFEFMAEADYCFRRIVWSTELNALKMLSCTKPVRVGGFFSLKPFAATVTIGSRAVVVERKGLKHVERKTEED
jgi:hypothetical protein